MPINILKNFTEDLGSGNTGIGTDAVDSITSGVNNTGLGLNALTANSTGSNNTSIGANCLDANLSGQNNVGAGSGALGVNTTGNNNVAIGVNTLDANLGGNNNIGLGLNSLTANTSGSSNIALGTNSFDVNTSGSNNIGIGDNVQSTTSIVSNEITWGNTLITALRCNVTTISALSDERDKTNIINLPLGLDYINATRPVEFTWNRREGEFKKGEKDIGFIAQELLQVQEDYDAHHVDGVLTSNPERLEASYASLLPIMVQAIKDLSAEVDRLKNK